MYFLLDSLFGVKGYNYFVNNELEGIWGKNGSNKCVFSFYDPAWPVEKSEKRLKKTRPSGVEIQNLDLRDTQQKC